MNTTNSAAHLYFTWLDYSFFCAVSSISVLIGLYFGFFDRKQNSRSEYIHGGRAMKVLPVAASLVASDVSGVMLLGVPSDVYTHGSALWFSVISEVVTVLVTVQIFLPVFYKLQVNSSFEYLKMRFDNKVSMVASATFAFTSLIYLPIVMYVPAIAFSQVTGVNFNYILPVICVICIFYTTIGGIKAVVWTDTVQMFIMIGSIVTVYCLGIHSEGGLANIWHKNEEGGRIDFNLNPDPTNRTSSLAIVVGLAIYWIGYDNSPVFVQRFLAVPTIKDAKRVAFLFCIGAIFFKSFSIFLGLIIYARYYNCDPITSGKVEKPDQLLPLYVMDVANSVPGLAGLFIASIFCAALSSMSSSLNTMAVTVYEDFVSPRMRQGTTEKRASDIMKVLSVVIGIIAMLLVFLVQYLGGILQFTYKIMGIAGGPILAMFALGMLIPSVNTKGILYGSLGGLVFVGWMLLGAQYHLATGQIKPHILPHSVEGCDFEVNVTSIVHEGRSYHDMEDSVWYLYRITFYYYCLIGLVITTLLALPISWATGGGKQIINKDLLSPVIYPLLNRKYQSDDIIFSSEMQNLKCKLKNVDEEIYK